MTATLPVDGRLARSARTRSAVIDALLQLNLEGDLSPTAGRVAQRAGVALRTVYGHFADLESLFAEAGLRALHRVRELSIAFTASWADDPGRLPLEQRARRFAEARGVVLEWLLPISRAAALREGLSPQMQRNRAQFVALGDSEVRVLFAPELAGLDEAAASRAVHALHVVAGGPAWAALRQDRGLPPEAAVSLLGDLVVATARAVFPVTARHT
ncbi:MAG: TetR family transcriptional regulator [Frankiales bacterium]|nr:TetR family transcriptional regulator [Frankiales bacterium]